MVFHRKKFVSWAADFWRNQYTGPSGTYLANYVAGEKPKIGNRPIESPHRPRPEKKRMIDVGVSKGLSQGSTKETTLPRKEKRNMGYNVLNAQAGRASKKVTGRKALNTFKKHKKVRVSKQLRKKIKAVVDSGHVYGEYRTTRIGNVGVIRDATAGTNITPTLQNIAGYGMQTVYTKLGSRYATDFRVLWNSMASASPTVSEGDDWNFFSPLRFMDAASILWNEKLATRNPYVQAGNFQMEVSVSTGVPTATGTAADPKLQMTKIHIVNSFVEFEMKNNSTRSMHLKLYVCVPRQRFPNKAPLDAIFQGLTGEVTGNNTGYFIVGQGPGGLQTQPDLLIGNPSVPPKASPSFNATYKYETIQIDIAPGETVCQSIQGPRNMDLDFNKLFNAQDDRSGFFYKPTTICVVMEIVYDLQVTKSNNFSGRLLPDTTKLPNNSVLGLPLTCEVRETFKLTMPDNAGFIMQAIASGTTQVMTMRKKAIAYGLFAEPANPAAAFPDYSLLSEENPLDVQASSDRG